MVSEITQLGTYNRKKVDEGRKPLRLIRDRVTELVEEKLKLSSKFEFNQTIEKIFQYEKNTRGAEMIDALKNFFLSHPSAWSDFIRKLHKYKGENIDISQREKPVDDVVLGNISDILLIKERKPDIGNKLYRALVFIMQGRENICSLMRARIFEHTQKHRSMLDISGRSILSIPENQRKITFQKLIKNGLMQNIDDCDEHNVEPKFNEVFPRIIEYLGKLYKKRYSTKITRSTSTLGLSTALAEMFKHGDYGDAWMIIQGFYAWARINEIITMCEEGEEFCKPQNFVPFLRSQRINIHGEIEQRLSSTGVTVYSGKCIIDGREYQIMWRPKSVESILQKMWQKEDYNNHDTMRDTIGMMLVNPKGLESGKKLELIHRISQLMPNYGYIFKDKGVLTDEAFTQIQHELAEANAINGKIPVKITREKNTNTKEDVNNLAFSGFIGIKRGKSLGMEVQIIDEEIYEKKIDDDFYYKIRGGIEGMNRSPKYLLPSELFELLMGRYGLDEGSRAQIGEMVKRMITEGYLIPYLSRGKYLIFSYKTHTQAIEEDMGKNIKKISLSDPRELSQLHQYIDDYNNFRRNVLYTNEKTSLQPHNQGQGGKSRALRMVPTNSRYTIPAPKLDE